MNAFELEAVLTLDSSAYDAGLSDAEGKASSMGGKIASGFGTVAKAGAVAVTAAVAVGTAAVGAFAGAARQTAAYGDNIDKMSQKMGMSAQAYQEWDAVMQHSGTSMEAMKAGMKTLANAVEKGNDAFQRIGLTQQEIASMSQEDLFAATIAGLQGVENETERTYLAGQLLGRGATELGALLNTSAEDTQAMRDRVHELGGALSDEAVKNAARFQDSLQDMHTAIDGAKNSLVSGFLPAISDVMDGIGNVVSGFDVEGGLEQIQQGVDGFIANMGEVIPRVMELAGQIIPAFASAIATNLPQIAQAGMDMILQLGQSIADNIPQIINNLPQIITGIVNFIATNLPRIVEVGIQIVAAIGKGLIQAIPQLVAAAPQIISTLLTALIASGAVLVQAGLQLLNFIKNGLIAAGGQLLAAGQQLVQRIKSGLVAAGGQLLSAGQQLVQKIASGITQGISHVISVVKSIINRIKSAFTGGGWSSVGGNIVRGIASGITAGVGAIISAAKSAAQKALNAAKAFLGISSPSKLFRDEVGYFMGLGVAAGIEDSEDKAVQAAVKLAQDTYSKAKEWIRRNSKMDKWSLQDELNAWLDVQAGFNEGSQQWLDAEETIFDLREKMHDEFMDDEQDRINRDIKRNKRSITEQIQMWTEYRDRYEKNSEDWLKIDDKIFDLREDLVEDYEKKVEDFGKNAEKIWDNIAKAQENYNDKLESTVDRIAGAYGLFDDVQDREVMSGEEITTNLQRQVNVLNSFYSGLDQLSARGVSGEMVEEIRGMGPKAVDQLEALLSMTDDQLSRYTDLYAEKQQIANEEALEELSGLKAETEAVIQENVDSLIDLYSENGPDIGEALTTGITDGIKRGMSDVIDAAIDLAESTVENIKSRFVTGPVDAFKQMMGTSKVPFGSSGLGVASSGIINNAIAQADTKQEYTLNLTMADGSVMAKWIFKPLVDYAASKGQPIVNTA